MQAPFHSVLTGLKGWSHSQHPSPELRLPVTGLKRVGGQWLPSLVEPKQVWGAMEDCKIRQMKASKSQFFSKPEPPPNGISAIKLEERRGILSGSQYTCNSEVAKLLTADQCAVLLTRGAVSKT